jgi:adenosine kinase
MTGEELAEGVRGAKVVFANDYEYELIRDKTGLDQEAILEHAEMVVCTKGKYGSVIMTRDGVITIPAAHTDNLVDPVGAGDAYLGGLLFGLNAGLDAERAGKVASLAATYAIEDYGTQAHVYTREQFAERYKQNFGDEPAIPAALDLAVSS